MILANPMKNQTDKEQFNYLLSLIESEGSQPTVKTEHQYIFQMIYFIIKLILFILSNVQLYSDLKPPENLT